MKTYSYCVLFLASTSLLLMPLYSSGSTPRDAAMLEIIQATSIAAGIPPDLMITICRTESNLHPKPPPGDRGKSFGICQVKQIAALDVLGYTPTKEAMQRVPFNSYIGASYLRLCHQRFRSWPQAIDCYNRGPSKTRSWHHSRLYPKGSYVQRVCLRWRTLEIKRKFHATNLPSSLHLC